MKKLFVITAALGLILAAPAYAQQHNDHKGGEHHGNGGKPSSEHHGNAGHGTPSHGMPGHGPSMPGHANVPNNSHPAMNHRPTMNGPAMNRPSMNRPGMNRPGEHRPSMGRPSMSRPNYGRYHANLRAPRRFHAGTYRRPSGWYARRWVYGDILPRLFWSSQYWLNNWGTYGLMAPPPGCIWVRYGDDALLIDQSTGEVIRVMYGVFY